MKGSKSNLIVAIFAALLALLNGWDLFVAGEDERSTIVFFCVFVIILIRNLLKYFGVIKEKPADPKEKFYTNLGITIGFGFSILLDWMYGRFTFDRYAVLEFVILAIFVVYLFYIQSKKDNKNIED